MRFAQRGHTIPFSKESRMKKGDRRQDGNNTHPLVMDDSATHWITVTPRLAKGVEWVQENIRVALRASDEGVHVQFQVPDRQNQLRSTGYSIELKGVNLPFPYSCLMHLSVTGIALIELEHSGHTMRSALRHTQLYALVKQGFVHLSIQWIKSFDTLFEDEKGVVITLEICGTPFSFIQIEKDPLPVHEIFTLKS